MKTKIANHQTVFLIRHGATNENEKGICQGSRLNPSLSRNGKIQAKKLGFYLRLYCAKRQIEWPRNIYTSSLNRAFETGAIIAHYGATAPFYMCINTQLREADHGAWDGKTWSQIRAEFPDLFRLWETRIMEFRYPGGEKVVDAFLRVQEGFFDTLHRCPWGNIMIVAHAGTNNLILSNILKSEPSIRFYQANTALNVIEYRKENGTMPFRIETLNNTAHLLMTTRMLREAQK